MKALSLKELDQLDPSSLEIEEPQSDPLYEARLIWLLDNQPQRVAKLFREDPESLKAELLKNLQLASLEQVRLLKRGIDRIEADERVLARIVAPPECPALSLNPPKALPENEREQILNALLS
jgi:hypothetical protein